jgi:hypothetical protein
MLKLPSRQIPSQKYLEFWIKRDRNNCDSRKDAKTPRFLKSPSFPLCQRGMKGGFLSFFASLACLAREIFLKSFC